MDMNIASNSVQPQLGKRKARGVPNMTGQPHFPQPSRSQMGSLHNLLYRPDQNQGTLTQPSRSQMGSLHNLLYRPGQGQRQTGTIRQLIYKPDGDYSKYTQPIYRPGQNDGQMQLAQMQGGMGPAAQRANAMMAGRSIGEQLAHQRARLDSGLSLNPGLAQPPPFVDYSSNNAPPPQPMQGGMGTNLNMGQQPTFPPVPPSAPAPPPPPPQPPAGMIQGPPPQIPGQGVSTLSGQAAPQTSLGGMYAPPWVPPQSGQPSAPQDDMGRLEELLGLQPRSPAAGNAPMQPVPGSANAPMRMDPDIVRQQGIAGMTTDQRRDAVERITRPPMPGGVSPEAFAQETQGMISGENFGGSPENRLRYAMGQGDWEGASRALQARNSEAMQRARDRRSALADEAVRGSIASRLIPGTQFDRVTGNPPGRGGYHVTRGGNVPFGEDAGDARTPTGYAEIGIDGGMRRPTFAMSPEAQDRAASIQSILAENRQGGRDAQNQALAQAGYQPLSHSGVGFDPSSLSPENRAKWEAARENRRSAPERFAAAMGAPEGVTMNQMRQAQKAQARLGRMEQRQRVPDMSQVALQNAFQRNPALAMQFMAIQQRAASDANRFGLDSRALSENSRLREMEINQGQRIEPGTRIAIEEAARNIHPNATDEEINAIVDEELRGTYRPNPQQGPGQMGPPSGSATGAAGASPIPENLRALSGEEIVEQQRINGRPDEETLDILRRKFGDDATFQDPEGSNLWSVLRQASPSSFGSNIRAYRERGLSGLAGQTPFGHLWKWLSN